MELSIPTIHLDSDYIFLLVGLLGTTLTPYIQVFQQSSIVERGAAREGGTARKGSMLISVRYFQI